MDDRAFQRPRFQRFFAKKLKAIFLPTGKSQGLQSYTLLIVIIKPYNCYFWHFLLRSLVSETFAGPFHQAKVVSSSFTLHQISLDKMKLVTVQSCVFSYFLWVFYTFLFLISWISLFSENVQPPKKQFKFKSFEQNVVLSHLKKTHT